MGGKVKMRFPSFKGRATQESAGDQLYQMYIVPRERQRYYSPVGTIFQWFQTIVGYFPLIGLKSSAWTYSVIPLLAFQK